MARQRVVVDSDDDIDDFPSLRLLPTSPTNRKPTLLGALQPRTAVRTPKPPRPQQIDESSAPGSRTASRRRKLGNIRSDASLLRPSGDRARTAPASKMGHIAPAGEIDLPHNTSPEPRRPKQTRSRIELRTRRLRRISDIPADNFGELSTEEASVLEDVTLAEDHSGNEDERHNVHSTNNDKGGTINAIHSADENSVDFDKAESGTESGAISEMETESESEASEFQESLVSDSDQSAGSLGSFFARSPAKRGPAMATSSREKNAAVPRTQNMENTYTDEDSSVFFSAEESFYRHPSKSKAAEAGRGTQTTPPPTKSDTSKRQKPSGLLSPTKKLPRIPQTPHRPSTDAFWNQMATDNWNAEHSPRKLLLHPNTIMDNKTDTTRTGAGGGGMAGLISESSALTGSTDATSSSLKRSTTEIARQKETKKRFQKAKHEMAMKFLAELDSAITNGELGRLAAATGGVRIDWTNKLNTTAGRANWRRETLRSKVASPIVIDAGDSAASATSNPPMALAVRVLHHASIELAEKVIDDEHRLLNVIAHEFCHLANFMVSGITGNPHGKEFKAWAAQCSRHFGDRGIQVTTKHAYKIDFKYVWTCEACAMEFKRHSKSIDPSRHQCGACKGMLKQTKPTPRGGGQRAAGADGAGAGVGSEYQKFLKEHMAAVRRENPDSPQKDIMRLVAGKWAKAKQLKLSGFPPGAATGDIGVGVGVRGEEPGLDQVDKALAGLTLG